MIDRRTWKVVESGVHYKIYKGKILYRGFIYDDKGNTLDWTHFHDDLGECSKDVIEKRNKIFFTEDKNEY